MSLANESLANENAPALSPPPDARSEPRPAHRAAAMAWVPRRRRTLYLLPAGDASSRIPLAVLGHYMNATALDPDLVILAGGERTQATWSTLEPSFSQMPRLWMEPGFEHLTFDEQMDILRAAPADANDILLIAPGPAIAQLAGALARGFGPARPRTGQPPACEDYPSGALAVVTLALHRWDGLAPKIGAMKAVIRPEDLAAGAC